MFLHAISLNIDRLDAPEHFFAASGATAADVAVMRGVVGHNLGVKASGGIRTAADLLEMVEAGANRIGTSSGVEIVREMGAPADR